MCFHIHILESDDWNSLLEVNNAKTGSSERGSISPTSSLASFKSMNCGIGLNPITQIIGSEKSLTKLSSPLRNGRQAFFIASASRTRSGVKGYRVSLTPVASKNALAIAAPAAPITSSPAPVEGSLIL
jgi:hypothetical protein